MLLLYNDVKASFVQHSIIELSNSDDESENLDDIEDEGSDTEWDDDGDMITSANGSSKEKDKYLASRSRNKKARKGVKGKRSKVKEEDS